MCSSDRNARWRATAICLAACLLIAAAAVAARNAHITGARILIIGGCCENEESLWANAEFYDPVSNKFRASMPRMHQGREDAVAVVLTSGPNAGRVLLLGGYVDNVPEESVSTELYDPLTNHFTPGPHAHAVHQGEATVTAFTSSSGEMEILIAGGEGKNNKPTSSTEIYYAGTNRFVRGPNMTVARELATATLLGVGPNAGKILIAGGCCYRGKKRGPLELSSTELYNPSTNRFERGPNLLSAREKHTATLIETGPNAGRILIAGGEFGGSYLVATEIYDPGANQFVAGPAMNVAREQYTATTIPSGKNRGKILLVGGSCLEDECAAQSGYLRSTELYDPDTNRFAPASETASMSVARVDHTATLIPTGKYAGWVLVGGGSRIDGNTVWRLASTELYDPDDNKFIRGPSMNVARDSATAIVVP